MGTEVWWRFEAGFAEIPVSSGPTSTKWIKNILTLCGKLTYKEVRYLGYKFSRKWMKIMG
jgi:hypothetical protein